MIQEFLKEAKAYCEARGIKLTTLSRYAVDDKNLFPRLESGGECLPRTMAKVRAYMADHPPPADLVHGEGAVNDVSEKQCVSHDTSEGPRA